MFRKIILGFLFSVFCSVSFAMAEGAEGPKFVLLPNVKTKYLMSTDATKAVTIENQSIELVKKTLNITSASPYKTVRIRTVYNDNNQVQSLIVYLLSSRYKSVELVKINVTKQFTVESVVSNYQLQSEDLKQSPNYANKSTPHCPDETVQFVIGNNFDYERSVEKEVQKVYQMAKDKGYNPFLMDVNNPNGPQPTVKAYEDWLSCPNLKGFYNESHGYQQGIVLSDDDFTFTHVENDLIGKLNHEVILFDSCVTFHDPLLSTMTKSDKGDAQQYVAGLIYLPFGPSERTASCFWERAFNHEELNADMLADCSYKFDLDPKGFGITGNGDKHLTPAA